MIDLIMAVFPAISSIMLLLNIKAVIRDKKVYGFSMNTLLFFSIYALWMVFYFWYNNAAWPMYTALANLIANSSYFGISLYYKRKQDDRLIPTTHT